MPQADAAREFRQLTELISHRERLVFSTCCADLLYNTGKVGIAKSIGFLTDGRSLLAECIQGPYLFRILQVVDLLR